ncbi:MAG: M48 family metallopeptidase [Mariniblastus sp.]|nr:M48 family metallopeptidase [Mariniblastus sp.]
MDFFEQQDLARRHTRRLVILFGMAIIGVMVSVYVVVALSVVGVNTQTQDKQEQIDPVGVLTDWRVIALVGGGTLLVIAGASTYRVVSLSGGGQVVASTLGGRPLSHSTQDPDEQRVLNVVEEMAIASGIPVPPVFLLEEKGINAFAAGYSSQDAVIGVTRGCVDGLSRDELQGVIAHEFSHILNGDMRLNIRLIGFVFGIVVIGFIGWQLFRVAAYSGGRNKNGAPLIAIGAGLMLIGAIGTFFGKWIKASISRQREFLADASAVQFTRNPHGIGGALKRIGGNSEEGKLESHAAPEFSHMYFAEGVSGFFGSMFATHPPLEERIRRVEPNWDGKWMKPVSRASRAQQQAADRQRGEDQRRDGMKKMVAVMTGIEAMGQTTPQHVEMAHQLISEIPEEIYHAAHDPYGARAVLYALVLNSEPEIRERQLDVLHQHAEKGLGQMTRKMADAVHHLGRQYRLPLIDITLGALKHLSPTQSRNFRTNLDLLVKADEKTDLFEWILLRIVDHHLHEPKKVHAKYYGFQHLQTQCRLLLSALAWIGQKDPDMAEQAFVAGLNTLQIKVVPLIPRDEVSLSEVGRAMDTLNTVALPKKKKLLEACAATIVADQQITPNEAEMIRAISESLGCPMPPLLPGQPLV